MNRIGHYTRQFTQLAYRYPQSWWLASRTGTTFENVERFAMFIGYPRSGHSVIGSLLDAHPDMLLSHELDVLQFVYARFSRRQILAMIIANSRQFTAAGRRSPYYSYAVPTQWQGRWRTLRVIGDKQGEACTLRLQAKPELLERLQETIRWPVKFIHTYRNPYDNIATIAKRLQLDLPAATRYYFSLCETVQATQRRWPASDWFDLRQESFIADPRAQLAQLCKFLGVEPAPDYLEDCARIVFDSPHRSRTETNWPEDLVVTICNRMKEIPHLAGYEFAR